MVDGNFDNTDFLSKTDFISLGVIDTFAKAGGTPNLVKSPLFLSKRRCIEAVGEGVSLPA